MIFKLPETGSLRNNNLEDRIDALLPQTQCGKCDYDGCHPYARAIANNEVDFNRCPPGGNETIDQIAALLGRDSKPLQSSYIYQEHPHVAIINEELCIGCVKCINACPVDAIVGAAKLMHTVIDGVCTGCELCIPPCPVNCITMVPVHVEVGNYAKSQLTAQERRRENADQAKARFLARNKRLKKEAKEKKQAKKDNACTSKNTDKQAYIAAAVQRTRAKRMRRYRLSEYEHSDDKGE